jgi:hypothetical protein
MLESVATFADNAGTQFPIIRPALLEVVVDDVIGFDTERLFDDLGGVLAVVGADGLFELTARCNHLGPQTAGRRLVALDARPDQNRDFSSPTNGFSRIAAVFESTKCRPIDRFLTGNIGSLKNGPLSPGIADWAARL